jgi:hypothetical protein
LKQGNQTHGQRLKGRLWMNSSCNWRIGLGISPAALI